MKKIKLVNYLESVGGWLEEPSSPMYDPTFDALNGDAWRTNYAIEFYDSLNSGGPIDAEGHVDRVFGQLDYYLSHPKYGQEFADVKDEVDTFLLRYSKVPNYLFTVAKDSGKKYEQNKNFAEISISDDDKEAFEWDKKRSNKDKDVYDDIEICINGDSSSTWSSAIAGLRSVPLKEWMDQHILSPGDHKKYYDAKTPYGLSKDGRKKFHEECAFLERGFTEVYTSPNWSSSELISEHIDSDDGDHVEVDGEDRHTHFQSPFNVLDYHLSNKRLLYKTHIDAKFSGDIERSDTKISAEYYPVLHPRVKTYISLVKRYLGIVLKIEDISYNSINILPLNNEDLAIYIATNDANDINTEMKQYDEFGLGFPTTLDLSEYPQESVNTSPEVLGSVVQLNENNNIVSRLERAYSFINYAKHNLGFANDESFATTPNFKFIFYKRDKSMRFQAVLSSRLDRIINDISSLNKLHNPVNYKFNESDFELVHTLLLGSLNLFKKEYIKHFYDPDKDRNTLDELKQRIDQLEKEKTVAEIRAKEELAMEKEKTRATKKS